MDYEGVNEKPKKRKYQDCGRNATSTSAKATNTEDSGAQPEKQEREVVRENVFGDKKHAAVEDACQRREPSDSHDNWLPFGSHNSSCPISSGTKVPEGFKPEMGSINQVQIYQDLIGNENAGSAQNSPQEEHASVILPSDIFKGEMKKIANTSQWPQWTVSYLLNSSDMDALVTYYRILNLANDLNDEDLRLFLEDQLRKEVAGLPGDVIRRRLRTDIRGSLTASTELGSTGENSGICSICMVEYKDSERIASLYYCSHQYHADCIRECLLKSNVCPLCHALAIIPEQYPDWNGDIRLHRAFFRGNRF